MTDDADHRWGPAMSELTEKQRRFVLAMASDPLGNPTAWARVAGYSQGTGGHDDATARVSAWRCAHNPKIKAALYECARSTLDSIGPMLGVAVMLKIAKTPDHPQQLKAAIALANRSGFHELTEHIQHVQHTDRTGAAMIERIKELAGELGLDAAKLLGANTQPGKEMKVIEHKESDDARTRDSEEFGAGQAGAGAGGADPRAAVGGEDA